MTKKLIWIQTSPENKGIKTGVKDRSAADTLIQTSPENKGIKTSKDVTDHAYQFDQKTAHSETLAESKRIE